jgi:hypothetical protein
MRNTLVPLFAAAALAALLTWQRRPGRATAVLAGAATALAALYTYQPLKLLPVLVLVWTWWLSRTNRSAFLAMRPTLPLAAASFLVVAAPMVVAAVTDPASYFGRAAGTSLFTDPISELPDHWLRTLGMFTSTGDPNQRHDVGAAPLLGWPVFAIATVGLGRLWRQRHEPAQALILWSLPIFLLPPLLATEGGAPHFLRALGLAAPLAATIGIGASATAGWVGERWAGMARAGALAAAAAGLLALAIASGVGYQSRPVADRYDAFDYDLVALADAAGPADIAILDDYSAGVVRFLARPEPPGFVDPGTRLQDVPAGAKVLALTLEDLSAALGEVVTARAARIIAVDPGGRPRVWAVTP